MKKILITGENSYIGMSFENWISKHPDKYAVDTISTMNDEWEKHDFSQYDTVLNVAGIAHVEARASMEPLYYKVNRDLCIKLCDKAKKSGVKQFVFLSSMIVFSNRTPVITKDTTPNPINFYGNSKLQADDHIQAENSDSFFVASVRPCMVYGPNCKGNFGKMTSFAKYMPLFPDYKNQRSMIFIDNLCEFIKQLVDNNERGIFHPQNKEYICTSDAVKKIAEFYGKKIWMTKMFNPFIKLFLPRLNIVNKVFGSYVYQKEISDYNDFSYCVADFKKSIELTLKDG